MRALLLIAGLTAAVAFPGRGAAPTMETTPVFVAGTDGYHTYRIPALLVTPNRTVLAFCEGRRHSRSDAGAIDLLVKCSTDNGRTWSASQRIWADGDNTCGNPAPVVDQTTGIIWLLMTWNLGADQEKDIQAHTSQDTRRVFVTHSRDDGVTWARPREITAAVKRTDWHWYATGPVNGIQLERGPFAGRLIIPCNHTHLNDAGGSVTRSHVIYSDDHGTTWRIGGIEEERTNESTLVELSDGALLHNLRSYRGKQLRAFATSRDGGLTWSPVRDDPALVEPVCQASLLRYSWPSVREKSRILFANPASKKRENLTARVSYDEGQSWAVSKTLHAGPAAYSCLAKLPDQSIGCLYEQGQKMPYERIVIARFSLAWLEESSQPASRGEPSDAVP